MTASSTVLYSIYYYPRLTLATCNFLRAEADCKSDALEEERDVKLQIVKRSFSN